MKVDVQEICEHPYKVVLEMTETELAEFQDTLQTIGNVRAFRTSFTESQRIQALDISERISMIWRE